MTAGSIIVAVASVHHLVFAAALVAMFVYPPPVVEVVKAANMRETSGKKHSGGESLSALDHENKSR